MSDSLPRRSDGDFFDAVARDVRQLSWERAATTWDERLAGHGLNARRALLLVDELASPALLVGAGQGQVLRALQSRLGSVTGVDWSRRMVSRGCERGAAPLLVADAARLPFAASFASVIVATGVLQPCQRAQRLRGTVAEARRVLRPSGRLALAVFYGEGSEKAREAAAAVQHPSDTVRCHEFWDLAPLCDAISAAGLQLARTLADDEVATLIAVER